MVGIQGWEETQKRVLDCAVEAAKKQEPFYFYENGLGIDSVFFHGWVKTAKGSLLRYYYDRAPCGNPSCRECFTTQTCPDPNLYMQGPWLKFRCERSAEAREHFARVKEYGNHRFLEHPLALAELNRLGER